MTRPDFDARLRLMTIIWVALTLGVVMFAGLAYRLLATGATDLGELDPSLVPMAAPVLLLLMAGGVIVGRRMEAAIPRSATREEKIQRYQVARILAMATQEGPALAMIILSMLAGAASWVIGAAAVGVWTMFLARPRRDDLEALLRD